MSFCRHHPATNSRWYCPDCDLAFCDQCVYTQSGNTARTGCLHCGGTLDFQPTDSDVIPFWRRLNDFFTYPFQVGPLALIGIAILSSLLLSGGLIAGLLSIFVALLQIKYGFNVIAAMSEGEFHAPSLGQTITEPGYAIVFKQFGVIFVMTLATLFVADFSPWLAIPLAIFFVLVLPMSTIILAREHSLRAALNPIVLATSVYRIGWPYLLVYLYLLMMFSCSLTFGSLAFEYFGLTAAQIISSGSGYYFTLVMYSLMGYMAHQYRHKLEYGATMEDLSVSPAASSEDPRIHVSLQQGDYSRAMDLLAGEWPSQVHPQATIEKYISIARFTNAWEQLQKSISPLLGALLKVNATRGIPRLLRDVLANTPEFEIGNPSLALKVAAAVRERGDNKLAARLLMNQHKLTKDPEMQRESIGVLAEVLDDLRKPEAAARYRALRDRIKVRPDPASDGLSLEY